MREMKVKSLDAVMIRLFRCLACRLPGNYRFKTHIETYQSCFRYYKRRFNVETWEELKNKLTNLNSPSYASRCSLRRRIDNAAIAARKKEMKSVTQSLNEFKQNSALSNYKLCVLCSQYYLTPAVSELDSSNPMFDELDLNNRTEDKRMMKFWICRVCQSSGKKIETSLAQSRFKSIQIHGWQILYPSNEDSLDEQLNVTVDNTLVLIPHNGYGCDSNLHYLVPNMYRNPETSNSFLSTLYHNRLTKFALRKLYCDFYEGEIANYEEKKLESISKIYDESQIRSSSSWEQKQKRSIYSQFKQFGGAAIGFCLESAINSIEPVVTSLLCNGSVITVEFQGNIRDEFVTKYFSHNHGNNTSCRDSNCIKTEMQDFPDLEVKCLPNFITNLSQKQHLFIEHFVKNLNFEHFAEEYYCGLEFSLNGNGRIIGLLWSKSCNMFNEELSKSSLDGSELKEDAYLKYLENSILTTVNHLSLQQLLQIPEDEAQEISDLGRKFQIDMHMKEAYVPLPSYETMMRFTPGIDGILNMMSAKRLLHSFKNLLMQLSTEEKNSLTTENWLERLSTFGKFTVQDNGSKLLIVFQDISATFLVDKRLNTFINKYDPFIGMKYQQKCFTLICGYGSDAKQLICTSESVLNWKSFKDSKIL